MLLVFLLAYFVSSLWAQQESPDHVTAVLAGDIILGGLFPVHEKGESVSCGRKIYHRGLQRMEAMLFAIDRINADANLLPNISLGALIIDTCSRDTHALNQSLQFVRASALNNIETSNFECADKSEPRRKTNFTGQVYGVVGGSYSSVSLQVANLLGLFRIPQISPASTAKSLSDKTRFKYFARTVPPDTFQSTALVDIVQSISWSYVSTVYSEGHYGEYGIEVFHREAQERRVCIASSEKVPGTADDRDFDNIIVKLMKKANARGVVLFTRAEDARGLLLAAKRANVGNYFHWIASDGWGKQQKLMEGIEDVAEGAITVELQSTHIPQFDAYMQELTPETNKRNPWFEQYWEDFFQCTLQKNLPLEVNVSFNVCTEDMRLSPEQGYEQETKVQFVVDAVYAFAKAFHDLNNDTCLKHNQTGLCNSMIQYDGGNFYSNYILKLKFEDMVGCPVKFDTRGDGLARYDILNYQKSPNSSAYHYKVVGKWFGSLSFNPKLVNFGHNVTTTPLSTCSLPCGNGRVRKQQGESCCWICDRCEDTEYVLDEFTCMDCGPGHLPIENKTGCYMLEAKYMRWSSFYAVIPICISCIGIMATIFVIALFVIYNETPLVRASGRELSYMQLVGIIVCYLNTFVLLAKPSIYVCVIQRIGVATGFTIVYGSLLTKTNRIARIFNSASQSIKPLRFISPESQLLLAGVTILIQLGIVGIGFYFQPAGATYFYPNRKLVILKCNVHDKSFVASQLYNMVLVLLCTVYAVKTRKIPENFNESKFIGFTMYTSCVIWLAFVPIYFGTESVYETQLATLCVTTSLNASVVLLCLYSPKVYIILLHPDKNVRKPTIKTAAYQEQTTQPSTSYATSSSSIKGIQVETVQLETLGSVATPSRSSCAGVQTDPAEAEAVTLLQEGSEGVTVRHDKKNKF